MCFGKRQSMCTVQCISQLKLRLTNTVYIIYSSVADPSNTVCSKEWAATQP